MGTRRPKGALVRSCVLVLVVALFAVSLAGCAESVERAGCDVDPADTESVPRMWVQATLDAIRRDFPAPTVHSRNLWHLSAVMWDAYAVYTPDAHPYFDVESRELPSEDQFAAASVAISFAAHRLLTERYEFATGSDVSRAQFDALMVSLCHDPTEVPQAGSPAAVGLEIADHALAFGADDGSLERSRYIDLGYQSVNAPLVVASDDIAMEDPNRWQPLELAQRITQNGQIEGAGPQRFIGSNWGSVASFALPEPDDRGVTIDPGPPPYLGTDTEQDFVDGAIDIIEYSDVLGGASGAEPIDIGPGARGNNSLGRTDGVGHALNPATGEPYEPNVVPHGDFGRAVTEYWADGPDSETPPGHWNTIAIEVSDLMPADELYWAGGTQALSRFEWDLRLFFTLNAGLHDTAIAIWGAKRAYDYPRPISMIRYLGSTGGLPLTPGLVEMVTEATAADGDRHEGLPVGAVAVRSWMGPVEDPETQVAGVGWRPAIEWLPYQRPTFVSPAFAAYVSGHSGFSRAAADILTEATGSAFFPGGMFTHTIRAGSFLHEEGPTADLELQWATYQDAADEAGESRRYGGIHVEADDLFGRMMGAEIADLAWAKAQTYFD